MKNEVINWERMKKTLSHIKTKWKKINITKDIQFNLKNNKQTTLYIYTKWQNNHKDIILNIILHLKTWTFSQRLKNENDKKKNSFKNSCIKMLRKLGLNLSESFLPLSENNGIMKLLHLQYPVLFLSSTIDWFIV